MASIPDWEADAALQQFISGIYLQVMGCTKNDDPMQENTKAGVEPERFTALDHDGSVSPSQKLSWIEVLHEAGIHSTNEADPIAMNDGSAMEVESLDSFLASNEKQRNAPNAEIANNSGFIPGERAALFHHASMLRGKTPIITYNEVSLQVFVAQLKVDNEVLGVSSMRLSKKEAKDEVCGIALLPFEAKYPVINGKGKKKAPSTEQPLPEEDLTEILAENWIGELNNFTQMQRLGVPIYDEQAEHFSMGPFSCTVSIPGLSHDAFGAGRGLFRQKGHAKKAAAMEAIRWIRANKAQVTQPTSGKLQSQNQQTLPGQQPPQPASSTSQAADESTLPHRANTLATSLGITPPAYEIVSLGDGFCQCSAKFAARDVRYHPELLGEVGKVERVYGRKTAKAESAREVIRILEDILRRRVVR